MKWGSLIFASCFALASINALAGQDKLGKGKSNDQRSSGGSGRRDQSPPPQRNDDRGKQTPPPQRNDDNRNQGSPRRDQTPPPQRNDDNRNQGSPRKEQTPPPQKNDDNRNQGGGRQIPPPQRNDERTPRRDQVPPPQRNDDDNKNRNQGGGRRDQAPPPRNDSNPPRSNDNRPRNDGTRPQTGGGLGNLGNVGGRRDDRTLQGPTRDDKGGLLRKDSRTGRTSYGTVNNESVNTNRNNANRFKVERAPINPGTGSLEFLVRRQEVVRLNSGWRSGYCSYYNNWRDDYFCYPFYVFQPSYNNCVVSPWYYYPHLPAYLGYSRITIINLGSWNWRGDSYNWRRPSWNDNNYNDYAELDYAIDDLVNTFERGDTRALGRLIPRYGRINIALEGRYTYSINSDDLYDMLLDAMESTRTIRYEIVNVRRYRNEAQIVARHRYEDPWGNDSSVYHTYRLEQERGGYVIRDFGTSTYRNGW